MGTIYNCDPADLTEKAAEELKKIEAIQPPTWAAIVKTGMHKERPPSNNDWWYVRSASVLKNVYKYGPIGVSKLRNKYGGKKNRGVKKSHFYKGSGSIIRKILQQLEKANFVKKEEKAIHKGKLITKEGKQFLDKIASTISVNIQKTPNTQKSKISGELGNQRFPVSRKPKVFKDPKNKVFHEKEVKQESEKKEIAERTKKEVKPKKEVEKKSKEEPKKVTKPQPEKK